MRDLCFEGASVEAAVAEAARRLGIPGERIRYVVLEEGAASSRTSNGRPARIAILEAAPGVAAVGPEGARPEPGDTGEAIEEMLRAFCAAGGWRVEWRVARVDDGWQVDVGGPDAADWLDEEVRGSLQHVLRVMASRRGEDRVRVGDERGARERQLRDDAAALARRALDSGEEQTFGPLNSFERRVVHMAVADMAGVRSFSRGEGGARRLVVAPGAREDGEGPAEK